MHYRVGSIHKKMGKYWLRRYTLIPYLPIFLWISNNTQTDCGIQDTGTKKCTGKTFPTPLHHSLPPAAGFVQILTPPSVCLSRNQTLSEQATSIFSLQLSGFSEPASTAVSPFCPWLTKVELNMALSSAVITHLPSTGSMCCAFVFYSHIQITAEHRYL